MTAEAVDAPRGAARRDPEAGLPSPRGIDRAGDIALGLSVWSWAVLGVWHAPPAERVSAVRLTLFALNACVGALFLARSPATLGPSAVAVLASVPSMVVGGVALRMAPPPPAWPLAAEVLFVAGAALAVAALATLGRSFALLPALRRVVGGGPFRWVRHPAYLGELAMVAGAGLARGGASGALLTAAAAALLVPRVLAEERLLGGAAAYRDYAARVRWRLVPGVW